MPRTLISSLSAISDNTPVEVSGWVETVRDQKRVQFVILRDETGVVQLVNAATRELDPGDSDSEAKLSVTETISGLTQGSFLTVTGTLHHDERVNLETVLPMDESLWVGCTSRRPRLDHHHCTKISQSSKPREQKE